MISKKFYFTDNYIFEDDVVKIIPLALTQIDDLQKIAEDETIWTYFIRNSSNRLAFRNYCIEALSSRSNGEGYPFAIFDKEKNEYVGMTRLFNINYESKTVRIGHTWLVKKARGLGINKHCKFLLLKFIFEDLKYERVGFGVHSQNTRCIHSMESIGITQEGRCRDYLPNLNDDSRADLLIFGIIKSEWFGKVKSIFNSKYNII